MPLKGGRLVTAKVLQVTDLAQSSTVGKLNIRVCPVLREQDTHKPKVMRKIDLVVVIDETEKPASNVLYRASSHSPLKLFFLIFRSLILHTSFQKKHK